MEKEPLGFDKGGTGRAGGKGDGGGGMLGSQMTLHRKNGTDYC